MDKLQVPPIRTPLTVEPNSSAGKEWYYFWGRVEQQVNDNTDAITVIQETPPPVIPPGGAEPLAANILTASGVTVTYTPQGNTTRAIMSGTITFNASDAHLALIIAFAINPVSKELIEIWRMPKPAAGWTSPLGYSGTSDRILQTGADQPGWKIVFQVYNFEGTPTPVASSSYTSPFTILRSVAGVTVGGTTAFSATEHIADRFKDHNNSIHIVSTATISCTSYPQPSVSLFLNDSVHNYWCGWFPVLGDNTEIKVGERNKNTGDFYIPFTTTTWSMRAAIGSWTGDDVAGWTNQLDGTHVAAIASIPGITPPSSYTVVGMDTNLPGNTDITSLDVSPGTSGDPSFPYNANDGTGNYWSIGQIIYNDAGAINDLNAHYIQITAQDLDINHDPIGPEQPYAGSSVDNTQPPADHILGPLIGAYGTDGYSYVRTGELAYVRLRAWVLNRLTDETTTFPNPPSGTLQPGSSRDVLVAGAVRNGRRAPVGGLAPRNMHPRDLPRNVVQDPVTGQWVSSNDNLAASIIADPSFEMSSEGAVGGANPGKLPSWTWYFGVGGGVTVWTNGGNSGPNYCRLAGPDATIYQNVSVTPGLQFYLQVALRNGTGTGAAEPITLWIGWQDVNGAPLAPYHQNVGTASSVIPAWTSIAISGYVTAPAGAARAQVTIGTGHTEPGFWDVDDILMQPVINQTAAGVTASTAQNTGASGTGIYHASSATKSGIYGLDYFVLTSPLGQVSGDPSGLSAKGSPTSIQASIGLDSGGTGATQYGISLLAASSSMTTLLIIGGAAHTGYNGSVSTSAGTKPVRSGLICND